MLKHLSSSKANWECALLKRSINVPVACISILFPTANDFCALKMQYFLNVNPSLRATLGMAKHFFPSLNSAISLIASVTSEKLDASARFLIANLLRKRIKNFPMHLTVCLTNACLSLLLPFLSKQSCASFKTYSSFLIVCATSSWCRSQSIFFSSSEMCFKCRHCDNATKPKTDFEVFCMSLSGFDVQRLTCFQSSLRI